jgi:serine/threonine-protein kinase
MVEAAAPPPARSPPVSPPASYPRPYGSYLLLEPLGQGGMSEVELARRSVDASGYLRFLVIKRIHSRHTGDEGFVRMFQDEARINAELQHENIAQVYDFGRQGDEWYLAMEYVPGLDLRQLQRALGSAGEGLPASVALRVVCDVLDALAYAHNRVDTYGRPMRIVHRDVNPRNIMVSVRGEVKLIDFGVAKADTRSEQTQGHAIKGKFAYMAPEQIESARPVDGRADLFAVALILHELLSGTHPFSGLSEVQVIHRVLSGRVGALPDFVPEPMRLVHEKALQLDPDARYPDARALRAAIEAAAPSMGGLASREQLAAFLRKAAPEAIEVVTERLSRYREAHTQEGLHSVSRAAPLAPMPPPAERAFDRTGSGQGSGSHPGSAARGAGPTPPQEPSHSRSSVGSGTWSGSAPAEGPAPPPPQSAGASRALPIGIGVMVGVVLAGLAAAAAAFVLLPSLLQGPAAEALPTPTPAPMSAAPTPKPAVEDAPAEAAPDIGEAPAPTPAPPSPKSTKAKAEPKPAGKSSGKPPAPSTAAEAAPAPAPEPAPTAAPAPSPAPSPAPAPAPEAGPKAAAEQGFLSVIGATPGAQVFVDGRPIGTTPIRSLRLPVGVHELKVVGADGATVQRRVTIEVGKNNMIRL